MSFNFFRLFFQGKYQEATRVSPDSLDAFTLNHAHIAHVLNNSNCTSEDILSLPVEHKVLELVALRNEAGFNYNNAIKIRQALQQKAPTILNQIALVDISLKIRPINESGLEIFEEVELGKDNSCPLLSRRILSIVEFIVSNHCLAALPKPILEKAYTFFSSQLNSQTVPIYKAYYNFAQLSYYLRNYDQALTYFRKSWELGNTTDTCEEGLLKCLGALDYYSEAFTHIRRSLNLGRNGFRLRFRYAQLFSYFGDGNRSLENLDIAYELLMKEVHNLTEFACIFHGFGNYNLAIKYYYNIIAVIPIYNQICSGMASMLRLAGTDTSSTIKDESVEAIDQDLESFCRQVAVSIPNSYDTAIATAILANWKKSSISEIDILIEARSKAPDSAYIANRLLTLLGDKHLPLKEQICLHFLKYDNFENKPEFMLQLAGFYLKTGYILEVYQIMDYFQDFLFNEIDQAYISYARCLTLYFSLGFAVPSVRDSILFNNLMFTTTSMKLKEKVFEWKKCVDELYQINYNRQKHKTLKRIAFISPHFRGHVVSLFSIDVIKEMSLLEELEVLVIPVDRSCKDSSFLQDVKQISSIKVVEIYEPASSLIKSLTEMDIDVLIDIDGLTSMLTVPIMYTMPAVVNCTWLGFDAPYISEKNYALCDWYTHPEGVDDFYVEKLIRLPHSHMCVGSLGVVDKDRQAVRHELGISDDKIVFIYPAAVRKFNFNIAIAHAEILKQVPNSVLMVKTSGGHAERPLQVWKEEFSTVGVSHDRIIFIPHSKTPEEHRFYFKVADIYLDAYPYNGGSQTVEALWCELPVVTYCGEQSFARMGYSFLSSVGITEGIAHSWEEYVEWAVRLATDKELYQKIKQRLWEAKQPETLSPLWNPKQFARDMYDILQDLYEKAKV